MKNVFDFHHQVLFAWAEYRLTHPDVPAPAVLTLDHHTDILPAFRDPARIVAWDAWRDPRQLRNAVAELHHDEHFNWAVRSGLVSRVTIASHVNATPPSLPELAVRCDARWQNENHVFADPERFRSVADSVLESGYLRSMFGDTLPDHFILDIDCDYFATVKSFHPSDSSFFRRMMQKAELVTVSREEDWVRLLRFPREIFDTNDILNSLSLDMTEK